MSKAGCRTARKLEKAEFFRANHKRLICTERVSSSNQCEFRKIAVRKAGLIDQFIDYLIKKREEMILIKTKKK